MIKKFILSLALLLSCCTPAERQKLGIPAISTIDSVGILISNALGWCESHGADARSLADAKAAIEQKDYTSALDLTWHVLDEVSRTEHVDPNVVAALKVVQEALASEAIQNGMRALSSDKK